MSRFQIYSHDTLIGWSELEIGDPPMGVAFGKFLPGPEYEAIQSFIIGDSEESQEDLAISIRLANGGEMLKTLGGVRITDHSADLGEDGIQIEVLGISYPSYEALFPEHVATYAKQFSRNG